MGLNYIQESGQAYFAAANLGSVWAATAADTLS